MHEVTDDEVAALVDAHHHLRARHARVLELDQTQRLAGLQPYLHLTTEGRLHVLELRIGLVGEHLRDVHEIVFLVLVHPRHRVGRRAAGDRLHAQRVQIGQSVELVRVRMRDDHAGDRRVRLPLDLLDHRLRQRGHELCVDERHLASIVVVEGVRVEAVGVRGEHAELAGLGRRRAAQTQRYRGQDGKRLAQKRTHALPPVGG